MKKFISNKYSTHDILLIFEQQNFLLQSETTLEKLHSNLLHNDKARLTYHSIKNEKKSLQDNNVKRVFYEQIPEIIFISNNRENNYTQRPGYTYINLPSELEGLFTISAQGKSAKNMLDQFLFDYAYCAETISVSSIPVYYLEPNTRIFVRDDNSKINGEYIISSINLPLAYNGTMSISATKATQNIY